MCINVPGLEFLGAVVPGAVKILCMHNIVPTTVVPIELRGVGIEFTDREAY
jgi:hypothetical protein